MRKACHSPDGCKRLAFINEERDKANLQRVAITDGGIQWVNAPPVLDVQETLHSVVAENRELRKEVGDLKLEMAKMKSTLDGLAAKPTPAQKEHEPKEGNGGKGAKGKAKGKGGLKGGEKV